MAENERMQWKDLLSAKRVGRDSSPDDRSEFQRDTDRILFCDPFRRLARKTQVHPLNENDHIHSRLTHSLETASVGRSLGRGVGAFLQQRGELPEGAYPHHLGEIVHAACLAHDIGNPPFGHSGESAIKSWFTENADAIGHLDFGCRTDFTKFDGNAMSVRILANTGFYGEGMNPTCAVMGALLKYPWPSGYDCGKDKFSVFRTESATMDEVADTLGLIRLGGRWARHPLAHLTEAADDICYRIIDLEDATEMKILDEDFMFESFRDVLGIEQGTQRHEGYAALHFRQRNSIFRAKLIGAAIETCQQAFETHYDAIMAGGFDQGSSLLKVSDSPIAQRIRSVYASIEDTLFLSRRKVILELGAQNAMRVLLDAIVPDVTRFCTGEPSPRREHIRILIGEQVIDRIQRDRERCHYHALMAALDYVTGMSDQYATDLCRQLLGLGF